MLPFLELWDICKEVRVVCIRHNIVISNRVAQKQILTTGVLYKISSFYYDLKFIPTINQRHLINGPITFTFICLLWMSRNIFFLLYKIWTELKNCIYVSNNLKTRIF